MPNPDKEDSGISLLYVEDEPDARELICEIIGRRYPDLRLLVAGNGEEGIRLFKANRPEIVLTDINMPVFNGLRMAEDIKLLCPATEIIALTAHSNSEHLLKAIEIGISHYILKPIDIKQVFRVIDKSLDLIRSERIIAHKNRQILKLNTELTEKAVELEAANRELESFNYTVAHDLRSPMVSIKGFAQILVEKYDSDLDDAGKEYLHIITAGITRMNNLIEALLKLSMYQRKQIHKKWTSLTDIAYEVRDSLLMQDPLRQATFSIDEGINGYCEPSLMLIALENLFGNAWKYSAKKDDALIEFGTLNKDEDLVYFVRDNGAGFDQQDSAGLFAPFQRFQSDEGIEGFGIGLATVSRIIQRHGGRIWAEGEKGKGATFYFTL
jgi:two-component system sensor histidine kinase/response regulator